AIKFDLLACAAAVGRAPTRIASDAAILLLGETLTRGGPEPGSRGSSVRKIEGVDAGEGQIWVSIGMDAVNEATVARSAASKVKGGAGSWASSVAVEFSAVVLVGGEGRSMGPSDCVAGSWRRLRSIALGAAAGSPSACGGSMKSRTCAASRVNASAAGI